MTYQYFLRRVFFVSSLAMSVMSVTLFVSHESIAADIKFGFSTPDDHTQGIAAHKFAELAGQKSSGRLAVKTYSNAALGTDVQMQGALQGGMQEIMVGSTSTLVGTVKDFAIFDFPYLFTSVKEADAVLDGPAGKKIMAELDAKGLVGLAYWENGFRHATNSRKPINSVGDFAGLKFRVMQSPVYLDLFNSFGANAVPLPFNELFTALETKTVDGQENPLAMIESQKFYEVQKYLSLTAHSYNPFIVTASKKWWDKLSPEDQTILRAAAQEAGTMQRKLAREQNEKLMSSLKDRGLQINTIDPKNLEAMRIKAQGVTEKYSGQVDKTILADIFAQLKDIRSKAN